MSIKTNTKDFTSKASRKQISGKRNSGAETNPKDELKALKEQKKQLKTAIKGLEKQETRIKKQQGSKSKTTTTTTTNNNKKKTVDKKQAK